MENRIASFVKNHTRLLLKDVPALSAEDPLWALNKTQTGEVLFPKEVVNLFATVRNINKEAFEAIEGSNCTQKPWQGSGSPLEGGGVMTVMRGEILEKSAVNMSIVAGPHYPAVDGDYAGKPFKAIGVSLISHPKNPHAPIVHMNVRCLQVRRQTDQWVTWIGGGADLTPMMPYEEDTQEFHKSMETCCNMHTHLASYDRFKKWADEYFFITHRKEARGVGGIFFDYVTTEKLEDLQFLLDIGQTTAQIYAKILGRRAALPYDAALEERHLYWRGRYAEFNLAYDRGTRFGLLSGGNAEAILCSLPPRVRW